MPEPPFVKALSGKLVFGPTNNGFAGFVILLVVLITISPRVSAQNIVKLNPAVNFSFNGWGTSLCWWANTFGDRDDMADVMFTLNDVPFMGTILPGLGINVVRYNVGGSGDNIIQTGNGPVSMKKSPKMPQFKTINSFWLNWTSSDPNSPSWDWTQDSSQISMLKKSISRGVIYVEIFSDSPPWWMTYNLATAGSNSGGDNLESWNYGSFAGYLATVAAHARDVWGIPVFSVEAFNEPSAPWWQFPQTQEGCHFDVSTQITIVPLLRSELSKRRLSEVLVSSSDENSIDVAIDSWKQFGNSKKAVGKVNTHGYDGINPYRGKNRGELFKTATEDGKLLWMSEYGDGDASGSTLAESIALDFSELHPSVWVYWQVFDGIGWGLVEVNEEEKSVVKVNVKYYVMAQFTRHFRKGMRMIGCGDEKAWAVAAVGDDDGGDDTNFGGTGKVVITAFNPGNSPVDITFDLSLFSEVPDGSVVRWNTDFSGTGDLYAKYEDTEISAKKFVGKFNAESIQTFEIHGVQIKEMEKS